MTLKDKARDVNREAAKELAQAKRLLLHVSYVAKQLCVGRQTVRDWIKVGRINATRTPTGHFRIPVSELRRLQK